MTQHIPLVFATSNPHKLREVASLLAPSGFQVLGLQDLDAVPPEPEEDGATFEDNAAIKARYYARIIGKPCLADDSGLEVDALSGAPGVHSARYAEVDGPREVRDAANNRKLLDALSQVPDERRTARFVCALCLSDPDGQILATARGTLEGRVQRTPRGTNGFGYDPLLLVPELDRTCAELSEEEKNARSHRGRAVSRLAQVLQEARSNVWQDDQSHRGLGLLP